MNEQQIMVKVVERIVEKPPSTPLHFFVVIAWWQGGWWKLFPDLYLTHEKATDVAMRLPHGWMHRTILEIQDAALLEASRGKPCSS